MTLFNPGSTTKLASDFDAFKLAPEVFSVIALGLAHRIRAVPVHVDKETSVVYVAMSNVNNIIVLDDLRVALKGRYILQPVEADDAVIEGILARWRDLVASKKEEDYVSELVADRVTSDIQEEDLEEGEIEKLTDQLISRALDSRVSDIHLEPIADGSLQVRARIDGVLHRFSNDYPKQLTPAINNRIKIMAKLDIGNKITPQSGRFSQKNATTNGDVDFRVETIPTHSGIEQIIIRILDQSKERLTPEMLGFDARMLKALRTLFMLPNGMIAITGPTGSGKTTTLGSFIGEIASPQKKTLTIENPVELRMPNTQQHQVNEASGFTFQVALKHFLRADPNVILVGEIRDPETAALALESAQTGHLVLTTLHTNDAASAAGRLERQGLESYLVASTLKAVLSQQLLRKLCTNCKIEEKLTDSDRNRLASQGLKTSDMPEVLYRASAEGCTFCSKIGYRGQTAVGELLVVDDDVSTAIMKHSTSQELEILRKKQGWVSLRENALEKVVEGITSLDEIERILAIPMSNLTASE